MSAEFHNGDPQMVDHTPGAAVAAGEVVNVNGEAHVCHVAIEANRLGALAAPSGKGVYRVTLGDSETFSAGDDVPYDFVAQEAHGTNGTATVGFTCVEDAASGDATVLCRHGS